MRAARRHARHHRDLAFLCTLVPDPFELREQMTRKDKSRLRRGGRLFVDLHAAWSLVSPALRDQGRATYRILAEGEPRGSRAGPVGGRRRMEIGAEGLARARQASSSRWPGPTAR